MGTKPGKRRGRGCRALTWAALLYGLATVSLNAAIDGRWPQIRSAYLVDTLRQLRACPPGRPDVVCIGTSRLAMAFNVEDVRREMIRSTGNRSLEVFNASGGSQDLITNDFIMEQLLEHGARPTLAVIEVAPELIARHDLWLGNHVMPAVTLGNLGTYLGDLRRAWMNAPGILSDRAYPLFRCRRQLWMIAGDALAEDHGVDVRPIDPESWTRRASGEQSVDSAAAEAQGNIAGSRFLDTDQTRQRQQRVEEGLRTIRRWLNDYQVDGLTCAALDHLLESCRRHGVRVLLVSPPVASEQRELYTPPIEAVFRERLRSWQERYDCCWVDCRAYLPDDCFNDNHHVEIPRGSARFSQRSRARCWRSNGRHGMAGIIWRRDSRRAARAARRENAPTAGGACRSPTHFFSPSQLPPSRPGCIPPVRGKSVELAHVQFIAGNSEVSPGLLVADL